MFYTAALSDALPLLLFLVFISINKHNLSIWLLIIYTLISVLIIQADILFPPSLTHFLVSFTTISEYLIFISIIWLNVKRKRAKHIILFISALYLIFSIYYALTVKIKTIDTIPIGVETIIILSFAFYFLYERMNEPTVELIYNDYRFWIILGMIIYLAGSFFIYIFSDMVERSEFYKYLSFTYVFYAIKNILFALGIWIFARTAPKLPKKQKQEIPYLDIT